MSLLSPSNLVAAAGIAMLVVSTIAVNRARTPDTANRAMVMAILATILLSTGLAKGWFG